MESIVASIVLLLAVMTALLIVALRLGLFSSREIKGRLPFLFGSLLILFGLIWQVMASGRTYGEWFVAAAYFWILLVQLVVIVAGLGLTAAGLVSYLRSLKDKEIELEMLDGQLSILSELMYETRQPYQLVELLNVSLRLILAQFVEGAGAIFLINRARREFVLTCSIGLAKQEIASLERYPLEANIVSHAIDLGEPQLAGEFEFSHRSKTSAEPRFLSTLILPLISGTEKIGGIILFGQRRKQFGRSEIRCLAPVAEWLAQKVNTTRLQRHVASLETESQKQARWLSEFNSRLISAADSLLAIDSVSSFCSALVGLASSESVHIVGLSSGQLQVWGGSEPTREFSENYRTILIDAIDKNKPLIINQESKDESGRAAIDMSTLVYPVTQEGVVCALVFRRSQTAFRVSDHELKGIEAFARLSTLVVRLEDMHKLDITRRKGFERILKLLAVDKEAASTDDAAVGFIEHIGPILPPGSIAVSFVRQPDGSFIAAGGHRLSQEQLSSFHPLPGDGVVGRLAGDGTPRFYFGSANIASVLEKDDPISSQAFHNLFGEAGLPVMLAGCPITRFGEPVGLGVAMIFMYDLVESERGEWQRMLTLATGLYCTRLTVAELYRDAVRQRDKETDAELSGSVRNKINNYLSAIVGNAELAANRTDISGDISEHFRSIVSEAEAAARCLKSSTDSAAPVHSRVEASLTAGPTDLSEVIDSVLAASHISDHLYMVGGRPREISFKPEAGAGVELPFQRLRNLTEEAINRFAAMAEDEDVMTLVVYRDGDSIFLDISRHRKNFPPVERVSGFGQYQQPGEALRQRPADTFLEHAEGAAYSFDRFSAVPSYLSFRFSTIGENRPPSTRVLAIDDQSVILDLISAMCRSLDFEVVTATSGKEGVRLASESAFDIILTDLAMPGMSGLDVARQVRKQNQSIPIILVTGWEVDIDRDRLADSGITDILYKPFRMEQLTDLLQSASASRVR